MTDVYDLCAFRDRCVSRMEVCDQEPLPVHQPGERCRLLCHLGAWKWMTFPILEVRNLSKTYRVRHSIGHVETVRAVQRRVVRGRAGAYPRYRRREWLGQVDRGALPAGAHAPSPPARWCLKGSNLAASKYGRCAPTGV